MVRQRAWLCRIAVLPTATVTTEQLRDVLLPEARGNYANPNLRNEPEVRLEEMYCYGAPLAL